MQNDLVVIDGSLYQGGGQIIRSCLALSVILQKGFQIQSIRKNRPNPGINNQLLAILDPFIEKRPAIGADSLTIAEPKPPKLTKVSSKTSSSCSLMMQCLMPVAIWNGDKHQICVEGGTDVSKSPPLKSMTMGLVPLLKKMGIDLKIGNVKKGYYPKGGGFIKYSIQVENGKVRPITLVDVKAPTIANVTYYMKKKGKLPEQYDDIKKAIKQTVREKFGEDKMVDIEFEIQLVPTAKSDSYGIGCILTDETSSIVLDCSSVGEPVSEEQIIKNIKREIRQGGCLDEYHQDQLLIYMALADGVSNLRIGHNMSLHTKSMLYVLKEFIPDIKIVFEDGVLTIHGIGQKIWGTTA